MRSLITKLKHDPFIEPIKDQEVVKTKYHYWRIRILYSTFVGYALYYFTRNSLSSAMPGLMHDLHYDKSQLGMLTTIFAITYGMSKFASGVMSDRSNPRYFMAIGLILTAVCNIIFGLSSTIPIFALCWGLNGWFQGFGWPPCAHFLTHWYSHSERGSWWSTWNVSHNVGAFLIFYIVGFCLQYWDWRAGMIIPSLLSLVGGFFLMNRLRDTPQSLGLPAIEQFRNDYPTKDHKEDQKLSNKEILFKYVLKNKYIWMLCVAYFFVYFVRTGMSTWTVTFLRESKNYSLLGANACVSLFEMGGFFGSLCAGWASDYIFSAKRGPVNALFSIGIALAMTVFWFIPAGYAWMDSTIIFLIGFMTFGPQMLIGVAAAELSHKKAAASATGFVGWIAYMGAAVAGYPLGAITQSLGWDGFFFMMLFCCFGAVITLLPLWNITAVSIRNSTAEAVEAELAEANPA